MYTSGSKANVNNKLQLHRFDSVGPRVSSGSLPMIVHIEDGVRCSPERTTRMMARSLPLQGPTEHHRPTHAIVMIALADDVHLPKGGLPIGTDGYLLTCSDPTELLLAITAISSGQRSKAGSIGRRVSVHLQPVLSHFD